MLYFTMFHQLPLNFEYAPDSHAKNACIFPDLPSDPISIKNPFSPVLCNFLRYYDNVQAIFLTPCIQAEYLFVFVDLHKFILLVLFTFVHTPKTPILDPFQLYNWLLFHLFPACYAIYSISPLRSLLNPAFLV